MRNFSGIGACATALVCLSTALVCLYANAAKVAHAPHACMRAVRRARARSLTKALDLVFTKILLKLWFD